MKTYQIAEKNKFGCYQLQTWWISVTRCGGQTVTS